MLWLGRRRRNQWGLDCGHVQLRHVADVAASFGAVTVADVRGAHAAMLASKPSLAAVGDLADVPYHATLAQRFS